MLDGAIRLQLNPGKVWLPPFLSMKDEDKDKKVFLQVSSIDTGAGDIVIDEPITVGFITKDREGVTCVDSCEFAFDGVCDYGTENYRPNNDDRPGRLLRNRRGC